MPDKKIVCVSIDLDPIPYYYGLHGLTPPTSIKTIHYTKGLTRFLELFDCLGIKATLFAVGEDLDDPSTAGILRKAVDLGHEPANHTWSHPYNLTRFGNLRLKNEIFMAHKAIEKAARRKPVGFRAPGYHVSGDLLGILREAGYLYDASLLPSLPYYLAKSAVIFLTWLRGGESRSIVGGAGMLLAPGLPYRTGRLYWMRGGGLLEIPCSTATPLGVPFIGTLVTLFSDRMTSALVRSLGGLDLLSIELHAIDMMEARADGFERLASCQPAASVSVEKKRRKIKAVLSRIIHEFGFEPMTLERASALF